MSCHEPSPKPPAGPAEADPCAPTGPPTSAPGPTPTGACVMDDLTRERYGVGWLRELPSRDQQEAIVERQRILMGADEEDDTAERMQEARLRAEALTRNRRLARAIRVYEVRNAAGMSARETSRAIA